MLIVARRCALFLAVLLVAAVSPALADADRPFAKLLIKAESEFVLIVDGERVDGLERGDIRTMEVGRGEHLIQARRPDATEVVWERILNTRDPQQYVVVIDLDDPKWSRVAAEAGQPGDRPTAEARPSQPATPDVPLPKDPGEGMVHDPKTDLIWTDSDNGGMIDWNDAKKYCEELELGGWDDWRLPTYDELEAMYDESLDREYKIRRGIELSECCVWSSEQPFSYSATMFNFYSGGSEWRDRDEYELQRTLCVRGRPPSEENEGEED